ncbi:hypothetical protein [Deinococcus sp.]|uniref:hypothetical protein n=1 Tax=Deinococcus sp. TaxID=47478 RepID=UPI003B5A15EB
MTRPPLLSALLLTTLGLSACGSVSVPVPALVTKAELRLSARLMMPLLSASTVQLAAREFGQPLLPVTPDAQSLAAQALNSQALSCGAPNLGAAVADADQDRIPALASAQLECAYTDDDGDSTSAVALSGNMTVTDKDDQNPDAGLTSTAQLSGTAQTKYKGFSGSLDTTTRASTFLDPTPGTDGYSGGLTFITESTGAGNAFKVASKVTLRRALDAQLTLKPDADNLGGDLGIIGTLSNRNDLSKRSTDLNLAGTLHAKRGDCKAADSGSVTFSKGEVSLVATVTGCGVYKYE